MPNEPSPAIRDFISVADLEPSQLALILGPFYARLDMGLIDDVQDIVEKALKHGYRSANRDYHEGHQKGYLAGYKSAMEDV